MRVHQRGIQISSGWLSNFSNPRDDGRCSNRPRWSCASMRWLSAPGCPRRCPGICTFHPVFQCSQPRKEDTVRRHERRITGRRQAMPRCSGLRLQTRGCRPEHQRAGNGRGSLPPRGLSRMPQRQCNANPHQWLGQAHRGFAAQSRELPASAQHR